MTVCKFWLQGNCRKGNSCNFEHPSNNRQSNNPSGGFRGPQGVFGGASQSERWQLKPTDIQDDLTNTRPKWILSSYGPVKDLPAALFVENEYSPEEVRWRYYQQEHVGNGETANREAQQLWQKADNDMSNVARNVNDVEKFMEEKEKIHPNRYDYLKMDGTMSKEEFTRKMEGTSGLALSSSPFGGATQSTTSPFSRPAATSGSFGQNSSPFGQSSQPSVFGQPKQPSPFGQPAQTSAFGQPAQQSAFGQPAQPSAFGQPVQASAFGRPSQPSAFGKPSFGQSSAPSQPAFGQTGFGQGAANQTTSKFGGPIQNQSPFGAAATQSGSAFGQTSSLGQNPGTSATPAAPAFGAGTGFGQAAQPSAFGKPAFGSVAAPATSSPFGGGTAQNTNASPFGGSSQTNNTSPFGGAAQNTPTSGGFGNATEAFRSNSSSQEQSSPFGQPQQQAQNSSPFGQPQTQNQQPNPFGQPQQPSQPANPFGQAPQQPQQSSPFAQKQPQASPFGQPQQPQQTAANQNPLGQQPQTGFGTQNQTTAQTNQSNQNPFGQINQQAVPTQQPAQQAPQPTFQPSKPTDKPVQPLHYTQTIPPGPVQTGLNGKLSLYRNRPVQVIETYRPTADGVEVKDTEYPVYDRPDRKGLERIWFPNGVQEPTVMKLARVSLDFQDGNDAYDQKVKEQYSYLFENGSFRDHVIPLVPPERGWIDYDF